MARIGETPLQVMTLWDGLATLVYEGIPGPDSLVASHTASTGGTDPWGTTYPHGDWCRADYELIPMWQAWPGTFLRVRRDWPDSSSG